MIVLAVNGSHRGRTGNTQVLLSAFRDGMARAGAEVETVVLKDADVRPCAACFCCATRTPGRCAIDDDMAGLLDRYARADLFVLASPLYLDTVTGRTKIFLDRLIPLMYPHFERDANGESYHPSRIERPPRWVVLANSGFPERSQFDALAQYVRRVTRNLRSELVAEIYREGGGILRSRGLGDRLAPYLSNVTKAGEQIVVAGRISVDLKAELERPILPRDEYVRFLEARIPTRS